MEWEDVKSVAGPMDMLLGFDNLEHFLVEVDRKELLAPLSSQLALGWMIIGQAQPGWTCDSCACTVTVIIGSRAPPASGFYPC